MGDPLPKSLNPFAPRNKMANRVEKKKQNNFKRHLLLGQWLDFNIFIETFLGGQSIKIA